MTDWREDYLKLMEGKLEPYQVEILTDGPKSLTQAWALGAMKHDWKKRTNQ